MKSQAVPMDAALSHDPLMRLNRYLAWWAPLNEVSLHQFRIWIETVRRHRRGFKDGS